METAGVGNTDALITQRSRVQIPPPLPSLITNKSSGFSKGREKRPLVVLLHLRANCGRSGTMLRSAPRPRHSPPAAGQFVHQHPHGTVCGEVEHSPKPQQTLFRLTEVARLMDHADRERPDVFDFITFLGPDSSSVCSLTDRLWPLLSKVLSKKRTAVALDRRGDAARLSGSNDPVGCFASSR
jgi:hypothetical protein